MKNINVGDFVQVPEPNETDIHVHEFQGTVVSIDKDLATVEDSEGDCFQIETDRLTITG